VPLRRYLYLAVVHRVRVFDDAPHAVFMRAEGIAEFPIGISFEVEALGCLSLASQTSINGWRVREKAYRQGISSATGDEEPSIYTRPFAEERWLSETLDTVELWPAESRRYEVAEVEHKGCAWSRVRGQLFRLLGGRRTGEERSVLSLRYPVVSLK
jgi:hypothetical protein